MTEHPFQQDFVDLEEHYTRLLEQYGDTPEAVQWRDQVTQERRMAVLAEVGNIQAAKLLDFGCGSGHLLAFLKQHCAFQGEYVGYDLSASLIAVAQQKFPDSRFERRDVLSEGLTEDFDYIVINGVFNNLVRDNWAMMTAILSQLFPHARRALAFSALSTYVDYRDPGLYYVNPEAVFRFCKESLSPCVTLRHDYQIKPGVVPFEFSMYVYATDLTPYVSLD